MLCRHCHFQNNQQGSALLISMALLLLLSLAAIAGVKTSISQERMAANLKLKNDSFQAAEAGMRFVAAQVRTLDVLLPAAVCVGVQCEIDAAALDIDQLSSPGANWIAVPEATAGNAASVWYRVVRLGDSEIPVNLTASAPSTLYRISVVGFKGTTRTVLEATYAHTRI